MPVIARFYGIVIKMYFSQSEHGVPHFHAIYGEFNGVFAIETLEMIEGDLPSSHANWSKNGHRCIRVSYCGCGRITSSSNCPDWSKVA
jgi:hypothetical protein